MGFRPSQDVRLLRAGRGGGLDLLSLLLEVEYGHRLGGIASPTAERGNAAPAVPANTFVLAVRHQVVARRPTLLAQRVLQSRYWFSLIRDKYREHAAERLVRRGAGAAAGSPATQKFPASSSRNDRMFQFVCGPTRPVGRGKARRGIDQNAVSSACAPAARCGERETELNPISTALAGEGRKALAPSRGSAMGGRDRHQQDLCRRKPKRKLLPS